MKNLIITYDLNQPGQNYSKLYKKIKSFPDWWYCLNNIWIISTSRSSYDIANELIAFVDKNDKLFVCNLGSDWAAWISNKECISWLERKL